MEAVLLILALLVAFFWWAIRYGDRACKATTYQPKK